MLLLLVVVAGKLAMIGAGFGGGDKGTRIAGFGDGGTDT
jgi:hypothetical protein